MSKYYYVHNTKDASLHPLDTNTPYHLVCIKDKKVFDSSTKQFRDFKVAQGWESLEALKEGFTDYVGRMYGGWASFSCKATGRFFADYGDKFLLTPSSPYKWTHSLKKAYAFQTKEQAVIASKEAVFELLVWNRSVIV